MREGTQPSDAQRPVAPANTGWTLIGQLAAGIAHEIKTPTQYVSDNVRFVQESLVDLVTLLAAYRERVAQLDPAAQRQLHELEAKIDLDYMLQEMPRALEQSADGLSRISSIVFAIKELSHPDQDLARDTDINHLVRSSVTVCAGEWKSAAQLELELAEDLPAVPCHPGPLSQVLINLVVNATHAIQARAHDTGVCSGGRIDVSTALAAPGCIEIRVRDNGGGMPDHVRARIFERYFTTKPQGMGTGQGLAIAQDIVVGKHGGQLSFETELGTGTTFSIRLPVERRSQA
jgi:signal transduction histidine kinase